MNDLNERFRNALLSRYPVIWLETAEEARALRLVRSFAGRVSKSGEVPVLRWSCARGFEGDGSAPDRDSQDPVAALREILGSRDPGFFVVFDLAPHLDDPLVRRLLREAYAALRGSERFVVVVGPAARVPRELEREIHVVEVGLPEVAELERTVRGLLEKHPGWDLGSSEISRLASTLRGLTLNESVHTLTRGLRVADGDAERLLAEVVADKGAAVRRSGYLEFVETDSSIDAIGGLDNLKDWLMRRRDLFTVAALSRKMPVPRGMLVMGMSGCGKSLAAKAVARFWSVPLFRLDMSLISSGLYGTPEAAFDRALRTVEGLSPAVLWIDEIENSLGLDTEVQQGNPRVFSSFLTWMQEKPPLIFVAATANRISALPAEVIRKGRFDQVFFVDLPTARERAEIFRIHIAACGGDPEGFDLELLALATKGWNGAEIEQAVAAGRIDAYNEKRPMLMEDITRNTSTAVPLSKTMHEQMKRIRSWAFGRATLASSEKYTEIESVALG